MPTSLLCLLTCRLRGARWIIDWHNLGTCAYISFIVSIHLSFLFFFRTRLGRICISTPGQTDRLRFVNHRREDDFQDPEEEILQSHERMKKQMKQWGRLYDSRIISRPHHRYRRRPAPPPPAHSRAPLLVAGAGPGGAGRCAFVCDGRPQTISRHRMVRGTRFFLTFFLP